MTRTRILAALVAGLTLAGVGTAAAALADGPAPAAVSTTTVAAASPADPGALAVNQLGGGTVTSVEREVEHGRSVWEVDVRRATGTTRVHVDTATGAVTRVDDRSGRGRDDRLGDDHGRRGGDDRGGDDRGRRGGDHR